MKIVYFNGNLVPFPDGAIEKLRKAGHEVIHYDLVTIPQNERMLFEIKHFQMYEGVLNLAEKENADLIYFSCPLTCPEVFISDLKARPKLKAKIVAIFQFREVKRSLARSIVMKELVDMPQIAKIAFSTMMVDNPILPPNLEKVDIDHNKLIFLNEPWNEPPEVFAKISKEDALAKFGLKMNEFVLLFSGSWNYIKGADIFVDCLEYIDPDIKVLLHKNRKDHTDPTLPEGLINKAKKNHPNMIVIEDWIPQGEMAWLYKASNLVVCAHRKLYEFSLSGVPGMACEARIPIIAPDFYYFNDIINRYNLGVLYCPENPLSMDGAIQYARNNYEEIMKKAEFDRYLKPYFDITDTPLRIIESL
jgi:glycosyltransferase involved in cell wall biosynthesis